MLLLRAVQERLGADAVRVGTPVARFEQDGDCVVVEAGGEEVRCEVLVGADGIHSAVRAQLNPGEGSPKWAGIRMWRAVTEAAPMLDGRTMIMAGSNITAKFVAYPISAEHDRRGRALLNWVAEVRVAEQDAAGDVPEADWLHTGSTAEAMAHFAGWRFGWLDVPGVIAAAEKVWEYPMVDRDPLPWWTDGRVTLLGDAAHPMYPIGSNGGSQAIVDARVLAWHLARHRDDPPLGLAAYEDARRETVNAIVLANRSMGPERVLAMVAERAPEGFARIDDVFSAEELAEISSAYKRTAGFDAEELNARPSWSL
jgi:2-polyprenyl-6-methoxyphenol hydroxylase-like FAD-dependent oxidoreductase